MPRKEKSVFTDVYDRSRKCIAQGALTNSKRPECFVLGAYPTHIAKGHGAVITDVRGVDYVDYICSLGASLFGHNVGQINSAILEQIEMGCIYSLGSEIEVIAAERLKGLIPFIDRVKFLKTGSEACSAAVKIARAHTGRNFILVDGYHGWHDMFVDAKPGHCVDQHAVYDTLRGVERYRIGALECGDVAAVIIEPIELDNSPERIQWLNKLREDCTRAGTMLIFDEVITGFRYKGTTASKFHGVTPDIICLGKAMGGGLPLAAVGASAEIMESTEYFVSSTFGGDAVALAAFIAICDMQQSQRWNIDALWDSGQMFMDRFNELWPEMISLVGYPTRGRFSGDTRVMNLFFQECARSGILFGPSWFYNYPLVAHDDTTLSVCTDVLNNIKAGRVRLQGEAPVTPFAAKQRK